MKAISQCCVAVEERLMPDFHFFLHLLMLITKNESVEFTKIIEPDDVSHNDPSHLDLYCLPSSI